MSLVERTLERLRGSNQDVGLRISVPAPAGRSIGSLVDSEIVQTSGNRYSVHIDREALRAAGYLPEAEQDRRFADEYRRIKRPILEVAFGADAGALPRNPRLVMMASALPGDGKTFTSINLALSLARERDSSVVLVDADVAKPHISRIFGVENQLGLLDVLADTTLDIAGRIIPTDVRGLSILPAGGQRDGATELLASARMGQVIRDILARNPRCIALFDSSPLIVSSESRALAAVMGQVVLVVRSGHTPRGAVTECLEILRDASTVRLVLNQGRRGLIDELYGYGYGSYGQDESR